MIRRRILRDEILSCSLLVVSGCVLTSITLVTVKKMKVAEERTRMNAQTDFSR